MLDEVFIRNHHHTKQAMKFKGRVFNDKGQQLSRVLLYSAMYYFS
jgi:hypothetical protein